MSFIDYLNDNIYTKPAVHIPDIWVYVRDRYIFRAISASGALWIKRIQGYV